MAFIDPRRKLGQSSFAATTDTGGGAPAVGGMPSVPNPLSAMVSAASTPSPVVQRPAAGTQLGGAMRTARRASGNLQAAGLNKVMQGGATLANTISYPVRAAGGVVRDAARAFANELPSPNAGQTLGGVTAPRIATPYQPVPVDFALTHNDVPTRQPAAQATPAGGVAASPKNYDPAADNISAANLAAVSRPSPVTRQPDMTVTATAPGVDAGVDTGTTIKRPGGNTARLPYGAMVDGVPTFSDGSGTGAIPRTMSDATIKGLGDNLSRADAGALANPLASDVGGPVSTEQGVQQAMNQISRPITGSRPDAEQFAASDRNAIAMRDPRSAAGIAARNLSMDAQYGGSPGIRRLAADQLTGLQSGAQQAGLQAQQGEQATALADQQGAQAMQLEGARGENQLANTALEQRTALLTRPQTQVTLADGTIGLVDPTSGTARAVTMGGKPAKAAVTKDDAATKRTQEIQDQLGKTAADLAKSYLPPAGAPADAVPPYQQFREQAARLHGLPVVSNKAGEKMVNINGEWVAL